MTTLRDEWEAHYTSGSTPWDTRITPPEVVQFWQTHEVPTAGLALDLGCGTATNVSYLAGLGLQVIGCDLAGNALATGLTRLQSARPELLARIQLIQTDVTALPFEHAGADYILDLGCLHSVPVAGRSAYVQGIVENLRPGGFYHLFAFDLLPPAERPRDKPPRGVEADEVAERFAPTLRVVEIQRGRPDHQPCRWYLLQKVT
jgi:SAM-dependent methyltransferase